MKKILVIEDRKYVLDNIVRILKGREYDVKGVKNGKMGVQVAEKFFPDLIVCDIIMPDYDGFKVLSEIRKNPNTELTPFVFLTALGDKEDVRKGMDLGADDYLVKPFTKNELLSAVTARLDKFDKVTKKISNLPTNIVHTLPHEIYTPLNAIIGFSDLVAQYYETMSREEIGEMAKFINSSGKRLHRVTENFLLYAQLEIVLSDPEKIDDFRRCKVDNPKKIIEDVCNGIAQKMVRDGDLNLSIVDAKVQISEKDFEKVIEEIVGNAFKFSDNNTQVYVVSSISSDGKYVLRISDKGNGISPEQLEFIEESKHFSQNFFKTQPQGLGLVISKYILELYGGSIEIDSEVNKFTTVTVTLNLHVKK